MATENPQHYVNTALRMATNMRDAGHNAKMEVLHSNLLLFVIFILDTNSIKPEFSALVSMRGLPYTLIALVRKENTITRNTCIYCEPKSIEQPFSNI